VTAPGDGPTDAVEVEWQFDALDLRPAGRWLASLAGGAVSFGPLGPVTTLARPTVIQDDRYLDTEDWRIAQAGYVLRVRHAKEKQEVTLKALPGLAEAGPKRRREVTEAFGPDTGQWLQQGGPVAWRVAALVGHRPIHTVLEVQTRRRPFVLRVADEDVAEVALDETAILIDDQNPMRLLRVEVEVVAAWVEALTPVVEDLRRAAGLSPAALSKFEAGVLARGYVIPTRVDLGPTAIRPDSTIGALVDAVIRRQLGALLAHEPGTRLGEDTEELHDMRVATRRLRAALGVFGDVLPPQFAPLEPELAWLADMLGAVRDLDVQLDRLDAPEWHGRWAAGPAGTSPADELRGVLRRERDAARAALLQALDSARYERLTTGLLALAQQGAGQRTALGHLPAVAVVPGLVQQRHRAAVKAARRARRSRAAPDFHRVRIRGKRLRYALEFVQDLYGEPALTFTKQLTRLQDLLGSIQDCQVGMERLHALATRAQPPLSRPAVFLMGAVAEGARREGDQLLVEARKRVKLLRGDEWHRLAQVLEGRKMAEAPGGPSGAAGRHPHASGDGSALAHRELPPPAAGTGPRPLPPGPA
jgi:triphosphatase